MRTFLCKIALLLTLLFFIESGDAHARWHCPAPRSSDTGIKAGPCGDQSGDFSAPALVIAPGPMTVVYEESIAHKGAPFRIALSSEGSDGEYETCILLNHIPHNDRNSPSLGTEGTYTKTYITIEIPDVQCDRCALQLVNPMTDKLSGNQCIYDPTCTTCSTGGRCFSNYHSCANVQITGTTPRDQYVCAQAPPENWPFGHLPTDTYYPGEVGNYTANNLWLTGVPSQYTTPVGPCMLGAASQTLTLTWLAAACSLFAVFVLLS